MNNQPIIETKNYRKSKMPKKKKIAIISSAFAGVICACVAVFFILTGGKTWFFAYEATSDTTCDIKLVGICWDKEIVIPKYIGKYEVTGIVDDAFRDCDSLTSIVIPEGVTSIGDSAFSNCSSLTSITIPEGVTSIGDFAFSRCYSLTSIVIPEGVTSIGDGAFYSCSSLTSITIPDSVTSIGNWAFLYCDSLTSIEIPNGVTSIGESAFLYCSSLTSITYNGMVSEWNAISKDEYWVTYNVYCTDGTIAKDGTVTYN